MTHQITKIVVGLALAFAIAGATHAAEDLRALQQRFKDRYPQLVSMKKAGKIGETSKGYVEAVRSEYASQVATLVTDENRDRRSLYEHLAKQEGVSVEDVAKNNALRNFQKASSGEYLKGPDDTWKQKP